MPQCPLVGLAVGSRWKAPFITCPLCLWLDLTWPPGQYLSNLVPALVFWLLDKVCSICSAPAHQTDNDVSVILTGMNSSRNFIHFGFSHDTSLCGDKMEGMAGFLRGKKILFFWWESMFLCFWDEILADDAKKDFKWPALTTVAPFFLLSKIMTNLRIWRNIYFQLSAHFLS